MIKSKLTANEANVLLFAVAGVLDPPYISRLYDYVQTARNEGDWNKVVEMALRFVEHLRREV